MGSTRAATSKGTRESSTRPQLARWREVRGCPQENNERRRNLAGVPGEMTSWYRAQSIHKVEKRRPLRRCDATSDCRTTRKLVDHFTKANHLDGNTHIAPIMYHVVSCPPPQLVTAFDRVPLLPLMGGRSAVAGIEAHASLSRPRPL